MTPIGSARISSRLSGPTVVVPCGHCDGEGSVSHRRMTVVWNAVDDTEWRTTADVAQVTGIGATNAANQLAYLRRSGLIDRRGSGNPGGQYEWTRKRNEGEQSGASPRVYEIWAEGYIATGMEGMPAKARLMGTCSGKDFREACVEFFKNMPSGRDAECFDVASLTFWSCRLFDNEARARKVFG